MTLCLRDKFKYQIELMRTDMTYETVLLGYFNLDFDDNNSHKNLFTDFEEVVSKFELKQLIDLTEAR